MPDNKDPIEQLIAGYKEFNKHYFEGDQALFENLLQQGQAPKVMMIGCCDSRVDPSIILNSKPGELFVVRNVANLVPPYDHNPHAHQHSTSSALEFAVRSLKVEHIVILGHSYCGGIQALMQRDRNVHSTNFIDAWMDIAEPARVAVEEKYKEASPEEQTRHCEELALLISLENLMGFPWIAEKVAAQQLQLHAWLFDLESGLIRRYNPASTQFEVLNP